MYNGLNTTFLVCIVKTVAITIVNTHTISQQISDDCATVPLSFVDCALAEAKLSMCSLSSFNISHLLGKIHWIYTPIWNRNVSHCEWQRDNKNGKQGRHGLKYVYNQAKRGMVKNDNENKDDDSQSEMSKNKWKYIYGWQNMSWRKQTNEKKEATAVMVMVSLALKKVVEEKQQPRK